MRFSSGITRRANSVLSTTMPADAAAIDAGVDAVERLSAERWLAPTFQLWQPASGDRLDDDFLAGQQRLEDHLTQRGYRAAVPTRVLWLDGEDFPRDLAWDPHVTVAESLGEKWLDAHMGRSADGVDPASRLVHRRLLTGGSSRFYSNPDADGVLAAIAKLSLVRDVSGRSFGGVYAMRVRSDQRGRGMAWPIIAAILHHAVRMDLAGMWIQIEERSEKSLALAAQIGFTTAARYHYLTRPA